MEAAAFDVRAETDRWAAEIVATFFRQLRRALLQSEYGPEVQAQRLEVMHAEIREDYRAQAVQISSVATQMAQLLALARDGSRSGFPEEQKGQHCP